MIDCLLGIRTSNKQEWFHKYFLHSGMKCAAATLLSKGPRKMADLGIGERENRSSYLGMLALHYFEIDIRLSNKW